LASGWGAFAEFTKATDAAALRADGITDFNGLFLSQQVVPEWMDPIDAVMLITYKETLSALLQFGVKTANPVIVIGAGPVGQCITRLCKLLGCHPVIAADFNDARLERARASGADVVVNGREESFHDRVRELLPNGAPFVVDAVGSSAAMNDALSVVASHGKVCVYGVPPSPRLELDSSRAPYHWQLEYLIFPTFEIESAVHDTVISYVSLGLLKPRDVIDDVSSFAELPDALNRILSRASLKAVVRFA
jgi:L-iditol 2-dehydrogenase